MPSNQQTQGMKLEKVTIKNYDALLKEVKDHVSQTQSSIESVVIRKKVEMAWSIGKSISGYLKKNPKSHGKHLFKKLESDIGIDHTVLHRMHGFYKSYQIMPKNNGKLNWNHYQLLSGIKKREDRKYLEDLVQEKDLTVIELRNQIKKSKPIEAPSTKHEAQSLTPRRGELLSYKLFKPTGADRDYIDCGFKIYREVTAKLPKGVKIISDTKSTQIYTYKARLKRVVDGDTLRVVLDLGFGILHEEILRLRGINAIEAEERGGKKATRGLEKILKNSPDFIVKTSSTDTYNRYLADIFLKDGTYLNQLLLDKKLATLF